MTINELCAKAHRMAVEKGWHETDRGIPEEICLMHSELSEALEEYRLGRDKIWYDETISCRKPEGVPIEMADAVIRILDFCGKHKIDLEEAIQIKMEFNATRPTRHGGKLA